MQTFLIDCAMFIRECSVYMMDGTNAPALYGSFSADKINDFVKSAGTKFEECKILLTGAPSSYLEKTKKDIYELYQTEFSNKSKKIIVEIV